MNTLILGAGASKSYEDSKTKEKMPIAKDFFQTFNKLDIAKNSWVLVSHILKYLEEFHNIASAGFVTYGEDIEILHSEVEEKLRNTLVNNHEFYSGENIGQNALIFGTYSNLIFLFSSVINEIQNGIVSTSHINIAKKLTSMDSIITFNWDTLMDRALMKTCSWNIDNGYFVRPAYIYRDRWNELNQDAICNAPILLKLHGSTNWLTSWIVPEKGQIKSMQETPTSEFYAYESTIDPYNTYKGRYMDGYTDFSYGYYPPNLPLKGKKLPDHHVGVIFTFTPENMPKGTAPSDGLLSMPLIIPPVKKKDYAFFGSLFSTLWKKAEEVLVDTDRIIIIGYSFPVTDTQTDLLFKHAFSKRRSMPEIVIVDPYPDRIEDRFIYEYGIRKEKIFTHKAYFNKDFDVDVLFE